MAVFSHLVCQELDMKMSRCLAIHDGRPIGIGQHGQISNDPTVLYLKGYGVERMGKRQQRLSRETQGDERK